MPTPIGPLTAAQHDLVVQNMSLVGHIVSRLASRFPANNSRDDLIQAGSVGLIESARRFDPANGVAFSTFATRRIEGAIIDMLRVNDWAPRSVRALERQVAAAERSLAAQPDDDRRPTDHDISEYLGREAREIEQLRSDVTRASLDSLDRPAGLSDHPATVGETVPDRLQMSGDEALAEQELRGFLRDAIELLPERHRIVMVGFFLDGRTMGELGELLNVTQSRASQIKKEAVEMVRVALSAQFDDELLSVGDQPAPSKSRRGESKGSRRGRQEEFNHAVSSASPWRERLVSTPLGGAATSAV